MSLVENILKIFLSGYSSSYKELRRQLYGYQYSKFKEIPKTHSKRNTIATTIWRLKKQGFIKTDSQGEWHTTERGKEYLKKALSENKIFKPKYGGYDSHQLQMRKDPVIVIFDIPERQKIKRGWLRTELKILGFKQLQKSVWIGKGPLPEKFIKKLIQLNIFQYIHIFEIKQRGTVPKYKKV